MGCHFLLQGIFLTQGLNPHLLHCKWILLPLSHLGSPFTLLLLLLLSRFSRADSVRPHRRQPIRLPHPWDSPGKNTGVSCHFLLRCMKVKSESEVSQLCPTLSNPLDCSPPGSSVHGIFQARVLEWAAIAFSVRRTKFKKKKKGTLNFGTNGNVKLYNHSCVLSGSF